MSARSEADAALRRTRRDLRGLVALECLQTGVGVVGLGGVALRAIVSPVDGRVALLLAAIGVLSLAYIVLAIRVRFGQVAIRRELYVLELQREPSPTSHPYRSQGR
ncbi:MAG: hypothetical protein JWP87_1964 [Labilithrix sp.]|nr:hypothetical protein [Labilithrix sp.]